MGIRLVDADVAVNDNVAIDAARSIHCLDYVLVVAVADVVEISDPIPSNRDVACFNLHAIIGHVIDDVARKSARGQRPQEPPT